MFLVIGMVLCVFQVLRSRGCLTDEQFEEVLRKVRRF